MLSLNSKEREQDARNSKIAKQDGTVKVSGPKNSEKFQNFHSKTMERVQKRGVSRCLAWVKGKQGHKRTQ